MTAFPTQGIPPSQSLTQTVSLADLGVVAVVPVSGYGRFSASWQGDIGSAVVEAKYLTGGGTGVSWSTAKTLTSANRSILQADVSGISAVVFEVTTAQADGHIEISTIAEPYSIGGDGGGNKTILQRFLDTNGDGTGTKNATGNYSGAEEIFYIQPPAGTVYQIARMLIGIEDSQGARFEDYGNITGSLSTGVVVRVQDDSGTIVDMTDGEPVQTNGDWAKHCYDASVSEAGGGNDFVSVRWTFSASGTTIPLDGNKNERLEVVLNDDLGGLVGHTFKINGFIQ